jgi:hypothetical protein
MNAAYTLCIRRAIAVGHLGVPTATSLQTHCVVTTFYAIVLRCHGDCTAFPLRFSKDGDPMAFVICSRTQTPSLGVLGDSTAFRSDATAMLAFCTAIW